MSRALEAMVFAREKHAMQRRKYTNNPYVDHLAEVAGIVATIPEWQHGVLLSDVIATAWLHDVIEDQGVDPVDLAMHFGLRVGAGVEFLSDMEEGSRAERKAASRQRLARAPGWVQTIKVADLISNTSSIVEHDPKFALLYLDEKSLMLDVLTKAHPELREIARGQVSAGLRAISQPSTTQTEPR